MKNSLSYSSYMKSPYRSVKHTTYFEVYDDLFARFRGKDITFVEIGVLGGGSLFMWRDFFGDKARIIGVDLNPNAKKWESEGFKIFIGSQNDEAFWVDFINKVGPVDVVLDDGGHAYEQQIITTESLLKNINDGGMLVVEDTHTSYMNGFGLRKYSFIRYVNNYVDRINNRFGRLRNFDDRVWSIQIYQSLVAFHVNRRASQLKSEPTDNGGINDGADNFHFADDPVVSTYVKAARILNFLKRIPGARSLSAWVFHVLRGVKGWRRTAKYF